MYSVVISLEVSSRSELAIFDITLGVWITRVYIHQPWAGWCHRLELGVGKKYPDWGVHFQKTDYTEQWTRILIQVLKLGNWYVILVYYLLLSFRSRAVPPKIVPCTRVIVWRSYSKHITRDNCIINLGIRVCCKVRNSPHVNLWMRNTPVLKKCIRTWKSPNSIAQHCAPEVLCAQFFTNCRISDCLW